MTYRPVIFIAIIIGVVLDGPVHAQEDPLLEFDWEFGPTTSLIGDEAQIEVPEGYVFLGSEDTSKFMELNENIPTGTEFLFAPEEMSWWAVFEFSPIGFVKDDEELDADALIASVRKGTEQSNEQRRERGWSTLSISGWRFQPQYDTETNLLEWAFLAKDDATNEQLINYNTRLLGRTGVMTVVLVTDPTILDFAVADFKSAIEGYEFLPGQKYADYRKGDRIAELGLAALIVGGAAAVATKKGLWGVIAGFLAAAWKFIAIAVIGLFAWIGSLFKRNR
jgi:uncharacterized membrane-anchored protein